MEESSGSELKKLVCINYPAIVQNEDKMLQTLGGEEAVSNVYAQLTSRLELRFRPNDVYCKPVFGDRKETTNLLVKVVRRRKKKKPGEKDRDDDWTYATKILGVVNTTFDFNSLMDFQYLPMQRKESGGYTSLSDDLQLDSLHDLSWFQKPTPFFIIPAAFSRFDSVGDYSFQHNPTKRYDDDPTPSRSPSNIIGRARKRRSGYIYSIDFNEPTPEAPHPLALQKAKNLRENILQDLRNLFQERPAWSRNAINARLNLTAGKDKLKEYIAVVAYYFLRGPWRTLWVAFGYDPRKDPKAKYYQTLDVRVYRLVSDGDGEDSLVRKRPLYDLKTATRPNLSLKPTKPDLPEDLGQASCSSQVPDETYIFREGCVPPGRQVFYQFCDVYVSKVQAMVESNNGMETECTEADGWLGPGILEKCRLHVRSLAERTLAKLGVLLSVTRTSRKARRLKAKRMEALDSSDLSSSESDPMEDSLDLDGEEEYEEGIGISDED